MKPGPDADLVYLTHMIECISRVIRGQARFKFRHMQTGQLHELVTSGEKSEIVETVPGWTHDITNIGGEEMVVMLRANEVFDRQRPETFACAL